MARHLLGGHAPSLAKAVMAMDDVRDSLFGMFLDIINAECSSLCQRSPENRSPFRKMSLNEVVDFKWSLLLHDLETRAPLLLKVLSSIAVRNDHRNKSKFGDLHHPGICMAAAVILKERNREMCGLQQMISSLMYGSHCEKKVRMYRVVSTGWFVWGLLIICCFWLIGVTSNLLPFGPGV